MTTRARNVHWLATGDAGAKETLRFMSRVVRQAVASPDFVWWARSLTAECEARDETCLASTVRRFVARVLHFRRDPVGVENITPPLTHMMKLRGSYAAFVDGDCDDAATLSAALGMAVGLEARFQVIALARPGAPAPRAYTEANAPYQHVYTELRAGGRWLEMDTTRPEQMLPPIVVRRLTVSV